MNTHDPKQRESVVDRVTAVLRSTGAAVPPGLTTSEVARRAGLDRSTTHRLLFALERGGFIERDPESHKWFLGTEMYLLGALAAERYDIRHLAQPRLRTLSEQTGESAYLSVRRGPETVCVLEWEGSFPLRSTVLREGVRFPLGVASAGLAILAFLPDREVSERVIDRQREMIYGKNHSPTAIAARLKDVKRIGYAINPGLVLEGSWGIGAAVFDRAGRPNWALSLTGIENRIRGRQESLGKLLLEQAHSLTRELQGRN